MGKYIIYESTADIIALEPADVVAFAVHCTPKLGYHMSSIALSGCVAALDGARHVSVKNVDYAPLRVDYLSQAISTHLDQLRQEGMVKYRDQNALTVQGERLLADRVRALAKASPEAADEIRARLVSSSMHALLNAKYKL